MNINTEELKPLLTGFPGGPFKPGGPLTPREPCQKNTSKLKTKNRFCKRAIFLVRRIKIKPTKFSKILVHDFCFCVAFSLKLPLLVLMKYHKNNTDKATLTIGPESPDSPFNPGWPK